jgi:hypothetical protein
MIRQVSPAILFRGLTGLQFGGTDQTNPDRYDVHLGVCVFPHFSSFEHNLPIVLSYLFRNLSVDAGDYVSVTNATQVHLSGKKSEDKVYRHYSGFMGGLKEVPIGRMRERRGEDVSRECCAVVVWRESLGSRGAG